MTDTEITWTHTCHIGPVCGFWSQPDVRNGSPQDGDEPVCAHDSCTEIVYEVCYACQRDMYEAVERAMNGEPEELFCPEGCGVVVVVDSGYNSGFAGEGFSWANFSCGHGECG